MKAVNSVILKAELRCCIRLADVQELNLLANRGEHGAPSPSEVCIRLLLTTWWQVEPQQQHERTDTHAHTADYRQMG